MNIEHYSYTYDLTQYDVIKKEKEQHDEFFYSGHPNIFVPDWPDKETHLSYIKSGYTGIEDVWTLFESRLDRLSDDGEIYDQNGGEFTEIGKPAKDGKVKLTYTLYEIYLNDGDLPVDVEAKFEGYIVRTEDGLVYLLVTDVKWDLDQLK